ncbi:5-bromo-4-chloroindolyl phosphate hydrolysis family protein [Jannaschia sp. Os4]|uniref:5-bromo-4-chloroindolyl phosphate hydrolysis family protein n=1 Tax=Jannaschia sp. Os4 TaxID=2807617 RepID=UPI00193A15D2|nr:5-bromo-4-chloroindolyl phosphate hydrolysis family protein [Jannaschia sp. Os4]MBM2577797.1 5-bromo-4-chloroindolyl phosphate hydrolysis family protein [Jannaschia sp. Os4]
MAKRFGGEFSPEGRRDPATPLPRTGARRPEFKPPLVGRARTTILMALGAVPVVFGFVGPGAASLVTNLLAGAAIFGAGYLTQEGLRAEAEWTVRKVARRPAIPRKIFGAALSGIGVTLAAMSGLDGVVAGALYGIAAAGLHLASFGIDPMRDKGMEGVDAFQTERVARTVEEAERHLAAMRDAVLRARDRTAEARVEAFAQTARKMFRQVEDDPRDLTAARKWLGVYLQGARDATVKFADLWARTKDAESRAEWERILAELEQGMDAKRETLLISDRTDLEVEIEVLRDRLKAEGLRMERD